MNIDYFIKGNKVKAPFNHKQLAIQLNFDKDSPDARLDLNKWRFVDETANVIYKEFQAGLTGGTGIFEGIPFDIAISNKNQTIKFENYLDLTDGETILGCEDVECNSKEKGGIDWLNTIADSFTFEYLHLETGFLPSSKFVAVPYVINTIPNYREALIALISAQFLLFHLGEQAIILTEHLTGTANPFQAADAAKLIIRVIYLLGLLIAFVKLIKDLLDLIIQPVKYHKGMYVRDLMDAACGHLGLQWSSSILQSTQYNNLFIIPRKLQNPPNAKDDRILGFTSPDIDQNGYFEGTFGDLLRSLKTIFNGKILINNGVLQFERVDFNNSSASYVIPDVLTETFGTNASEINSNTLIEFAYDVNDKNTIQEWDGTSCQVVVEPLTVVNGDMRLLQNLKQVSIPFALAKRKEELTLPENILKTFLNAVSGVMNALIKVANAAIKVVNAISKVLNKIKKVLNTVGLKINIKIGTLKPIPKQNFGQIISDRIGMMLLENDFITVPKICIVEQGKTDRETDISTDTKTYLNARYLYDNFYSVDSFVPTTSTPNANQWLRKRIEKCPFTFTDYLTVRANNKIFDVDGNIAKIESLKWNIWEQTAEIEYRINKLYTNNLKENIYESKGF